MRHRRVPPIATPTSTVPPIIGKPLAVRPVVQALVATPQECELPPPPPPDQPQQACDLDKTARYDMGPVALQLNLTGAKAVKLPLSEFYSVQLAMDPGSGTAFAGYTAANVGKQLAFVRNGVVLAAPAIDQPINGQSLQLSGNMTQADCRDHREHASRRGLTAPPASRGRARTPEWTARRRGLRRRWTPGSDRRRVP